MDETILSLIRFSGGFLCATMWLIIGWVIGILTMWRMAQEKDCINGEWVERDS